ncbi:MAG: hypothetical protein ACE5I1_22075, partial [bacterium]
HPQRTEWGQTALDKYVPLVRHEMMHVVQTLIIAANEVPFKTSLANRFGVAFNEYESQFFELMRDYLK